MIKKIIIVAAIGGVVSVTAMGQSFDDFLETVSQHNPEISAYRDLLEAKKTEARTGNAPPDPFISGGYQPANSSVPGEKITWSVSQSFAFPTKYLLQNKINKNTIVLAGQEFNQGTLQILLEAELAALDYIYYRKTLDLLNERKVNYDRLLSAWEKMLDNGGATIMDYNRIVLELSDLSLAISKTEAGIRMILERLAFMSGSSDILSILPSEYPVRAITDIGAILDEKAGIHPAYLIPEIEYSISLQQVKLSRSGNLPEFEIGYGSEIVPGESFSGPVGGISLPLWANKNKVRSATAGARYAETARDAAILRLNSGVRNEYSNMKALESGMAELKRVLRPGELTKYQDKALDAGEISITTYFSYLEVIYESQDRLLELENEYYRSLAKLLDHELLK